MQVGNRRQGTSARSERSRSVEAFGAQPSLPSERCQIISLGTTNRAARRPGRSLMLQRVAGLSTDEIYEVFEIRSVLEGLAVRLATPRLDSEAFQELDRLLARMRSVGPGGDDWVTRHHQFHEYLCSFSHRPNLIRQIARLHVTIEPYLRIWLHHVEKPLSAEEEHRAIIEVVKAGDAVAAEAAMEKHILETAPALAAFVAASER